MSDAGETPTVKPDDRDPELLLYDYSKFLLTLGLLILGGVLTLVQGPASAKLAGSEVLMVVVPLSLSCVCSLSVANDVVRARQKGRAVTRWVAASGQAAMFFLGSGVATFLLLWIRTIG